MISKWVHSSGNLTPDSHGFATNDYHNLNRKCIFEKFSITKYYNKELGIFIYFKKSNKEPDENKIMYKYYKELCGKLDWPLEKLDMYVGILYKRNIIDPNILRNILEKMEEFEPIHFLLRL